MLIPLYARGSSGCGVEHVGVERGGHQDLREPCGLDSVCACDLRLVGAHERTPAHDVLAADDETVDAMWPGEHQRRHEVVRTAELEAVRPPDGEVRLLPRLQRADVVPAQHLRAASGAESQGLAWEVYRDGVKPAVVAELAVVVEAAASAGDRVASSILDEGARELTLLAVSVVEQLGLPLGPVVLAGGTLRVVPTLTAGLVATLGSRLPGVETRILTVEPAQGAVRLAIALARGELRVPVY